MFKNTLFTEHFRMTASEHLSNMPIAFKTKMRKMIEAATEGVLEKKKLESS